MEAAQVQRQGKMYISKGSVRITHQRQWTAPVYAQRRRNIGLPVLMVVLLLVAYRPLCVPKSRPQFKFNFVPNTSHPEDPKTWPYHGQPRLRVYYGELRAT